MPVYVVTGARRGLGPEYIRQTSSSASSTVIALVRDLEGDLSQLNDIQSSAVGKVHILPCNVVSDESVSELGAQLTKALGEGAKVDVLINNAGIQRCKGETPLNMRADDILAQMDANVVGPIRVVQALLDHFATGAKIINISSGLGSTTLLANGVMPRQNSSYGLSKSALNTATVHQALALKGRAIVICVDPGHVKTDMGGPNAVLTVEESAKNVLKIVQGLKEEDSGKFLEYTGNEVPW